MRIRWTPAAASDLQQIGDYLKDHHPHYRQPALRKAAISKVEARDNYLKDSVRHLREKDVLSYAEFAAQIGIALASVAALVRARKAFVAGIAAGAVGILITAYSYWMHYLATKL